MAFFVVQRDADSALSIPLPDAYPSREAAIAALSAATSSGSLALAGEVFIADLSTAVPVLVMQAAAPAAPQTAAEEQYPGVLDEAAAVETYAPPLLGDEQSLAAALRRAATSLEEEGIIAPTSIESSPAETADAAESVPEDAEDDDKPWQWANVEAYEPAAVDEAVAEPVESEAVEELEEPAIEEPQPEAAVGETSVDTADLDEALARLETVDEEESALGSDYVEEPLESEAEPLAEEADAAAEAAPDEAVESEEAAEPPGLLDDAPIITGAPADGEDVYVPRPVILGDYADIVVPATAVEEPADKRDEPSFDVGDMVINPSPGVESQAAGYEAAGELDLAGYTCDDCVYSNTCPKVGQATPADCGSFQWRSE